MSFMLRRSALLRTMAQYSSPLPHSKPLVVRKTPSVFASCLVAQRFATTTGTTSNLGTRKSLATLVKAPRKADFSEGEEVELLSGDEARIEITERAAEKLHSISMSGQQASPALRIAVESGGCHGYQYKIELTSGHAPDDYLFSHPKHQQSSIIIDAISLELLKGSTIDYATELIGSSFRVVDNPQAKGSGCGCGVSWEAKI